MSLWQDSNGNGVCDPGEVRPAQDFGITAIDCTCQQHPEGFPFNPQGVTFQNGTRRPTFDWIVRCEAESLMAVMPVERKP